MCVCDRKLVGSQLTLLSHHQPHSCTFIHLPLCCACPLYAILAILCASTHAQALPALSCRGLTHITALTALSRLTELDAGQWWLPHENCRMLLHSLLPSQRKGALEWLEVCHAAQGGGRLNSSSSSHAGVWTLFIHVSELGTW